MSEILTYSFPDKFHVANTQEDIADFDVNQILRERKRNKNVIHYSMASNRKIKQYQHKFYRENNLY